MYLESDVEALFFHRRSLADAGPGLQALVLRLLAARVPLAQLQVGAAGAEEEHSAGSDSLSQLPLLVCDSIAAAPAAVTEHAARVWGLQPASVAGADQAAPDGLLAAFCRSGIAAVSLLSALSPPPPPGVHAVLSPAALPRALRRAGDVVVGYALSPRRELELLTSGALRPLPRLGLCALHLDWEEGESLEAQGPWDLLLHKGTDQLVASPESVLGLDFSPALARLQAHATATATPMLEPLSRLGVVLDRSLASALLSRMPSEMGGVAVGTPAWTELPDLHSPSEVAHALSAAGIALPCLLKPRAAAGAPGAHRFVLLRSAAAAPLAAPALTQPCIAVSFVPHSPAVVHKVYVMGDRVLLEQRRSLPAPPAQPLTAGEQECVPFDALHALPRSWPGEAEAGEPGLAEGEHGLSELAVRGMAAWLRAQTGMSVFGFDVLVEAAGGRHLVVDLNYLPSAKGAQGGPEALAEALRARALAGREGG